MNDEAAKAEPEKMPLTSMDIAQEKREQFKRCLAAAFPEIMAEDKIDFDQLKRVLGEWVEPDRERFGLNWPGKAACMKVIQAPSVGTLKPCREESVDWDTTGNLFIEGDNLEVLKLLQKAYFGKIKMIYIDPPYNTGKEFIYPDKYAETLDTYLEYTGQKDSEGRKFATNTDASGRFHSRWLNMMYPRLYLAKNLLRDDGVIYISISDGEVANLRELCDQVFGEENFIANIIWEKKYSPQNDAKYLSDMHDHILLYARNKETWRPIPLPRTDKQDAAYKNVDNDPRGPWKPSDLTRAEYRQHDYYGIITPSGKEVFPSTGRSWGRPKDEIERLRTDNRLWFGKNGDAIPSLKRFISEVKEGRVPTTIWKYEEAGHNQLASQELKALIDDASFDTPKPIKLISIMVNLSIVADKQEIVLDFFAGSCSTAHAVASLNAADGGNRKFIMVQLPESCDEKSEAYRAGFRTIADIGRARIKSAYQKLASESKETNTGFRSFRLTESCFKHWDAKEGVSSDDSLLRRIEAHGNHINPEAAAEDILFELLLKDGFPLTVPMQRLQVAGKEVFSIAEGALLICLEKELTQELMDALAEMEPARVICLDAGFKSND